MRTLMPFMWPKKDFILQLRVLFCFVLLFLGRVINLYVPIYNKRIVDSLSIPNDFRWDWILIYGEFYLKSNFIFNLFSCFQSVSSSFKAAALARWAS